MRTGLKSVLYKPMYFAARYDTEQLTNYHVELIRATTRCSGDTTVISPGSGALSAQKCSWRQHIATELGPGAQLTGLAHFRHLNARQCSPVQRARRLFGALGQIPPLQLRLAPTHGAIMEGLYVKMRACPLQRFIKAPPGT